MLNRLKLRFKCFILEMKLVYIKAKIKGMSKWI